MKDTTYDLLAGDHDSGPLSLETVHGLENTKQTMEQPAAESPGMGRLLASPASVDYPPKKEEGHESLA